MASRFESYSTRSGNECFALARAQDVVEHDDATGFRVLYADGDCEDLSLRELQAVLCAPVGGEDGEQQQQAEAETKVAADGKAVAAALEEAGEIPGWTLSAWLASIDFNQTMTDAITSRIHARSSKPAHDETRPNTSRLACTRLGLGSEDA